MEEAVEAVEAVDCALAAADEREGVATSVASAASSSGDMASVDVASDRRHVPTTAAAAAWRDDARTTSRGVINEPRE